MFLNDQSKKQINYCKVFRTALRNLVLITMLVFIAQPGRYNFINCIIVAKIKQNFLYLI